MACRGKSSNGGTGEAIRQELKGVSFTGSSSHLQKAKEALNGMRDLLLGKQGELTVQDRRNIFTIIQDLTNGTGLTWKGIQYDYLKDASTSPTKK